jgi:membrane protein YqaA with SNARE-associated domain
MSFYFDIFVESTIASSFIPFAHEPTFFSMKSFAEAGYDYNMQLAATLAVIGSAIGAIFCFMVGFWFSKIYHIQGNQKHLSLEKYTEASRSFSRYFTVLLPFTWLPLLNFLPLVAGFLGVRARLVLPLVIAGKIAYYGYYAMY